MFDAFAHFLGKRRGGRWQGLAAASGAPFGILTCLFFRSPGEGQYAGEVEKFLGRRAVLVGEESFVDRSDQQEERLSLPEFGSSFGERSEGVLKNLSHRFLAIAEHACSADRHAVAVGRRGRRNCLHDRFLA